jgi:hypothetical protein
VITHVAIRHRGTLYALPAPNRHHHVRDLIVEQTGEGIDGNDEQGFLDDQNRFLDRRQALRHALACDQIKPGTQIRAGQLFSEDVW